MWKKIILLLKLRSLLGILLLPLLLCDSHGEQGTSCEAFGSCSQLCTRNTNGLNCSCLEGFKLGDNGGSCSPIDDNAKFIYTNRDGLWVMPDSTKGYRASRKITSDERRPVGVTYDARNNIVYYTDANLNQEAIYRVNLQNTSDVKTIVDTGVLLPEGIAFDWIAGNIYFADSSNSRIVVCKNDSNICTVLIQEQVDKPRDVALNPNLGIMFWTDWGNVPAIVRAGMDGSLPLQIISTDINWPNCIAVDQGNARIYWVDSHWDKIESSRYDGKDRRIIIAGLYVKHPFGLDVFGDRIYWSDWSSHEIRSMDKFGKNGTFLHLFDPLTLLNGLAVFHQANQPILSSNPCGASTCSHICTLSPTRNYTCFCPVGMQLMENGLTCFEPNATVKLVVTIRDTLHVMRVGTIGKNAWESIALRPKIKSISAVVYNPVNHTLILSDGPSKKIFEYGLHSKQLQVLVDKHLDMVQCLDIDVIGENLYWVDKGRQTIEVMSFRTGARVVISQGLQDVFDILIVAERSELYVATSGGGKGKIYKMSMNGLDMVAFQHFENAEPVALSYDPNLANILWADKLSHNVTLVSFTGSRYAQITSTWNAGGPPSDIAFYGNTLYYMEMFSPKIKVFHMKGQRYTSGELRLGPVAPPMSPPENTSKCWPKIAVINPDLSRVEDLLSGHMCAINNPLRKRCSHVCLLSSDELVGSCYCPEGLTLGEDGKTCVRLSTCRQNQFFCNSGDCIPKSYVCDGKADCDGREDEINCQKATCPPQTFQCPQDGVCIPKHWVCDQDEDCRGGDDEVNCTFCDGESDFMCEETKEYIPKSWRCDGEVDCEEDAFDERDCSQACPVEHFKCTSSHRCVPPAMICDNDKDCEDGSDELNCNKSVCGTLHFMCVNGSCINNAAVCDGKLDCSDGGDEAHCSSSTTVSTIAIPSYNVTGSFNNSSITSTSQPLLNTTGMSTKRVSTGNRTATMLETPSTSAVPLSLGGIDGPGQTAVNIPEESVYFLKAVVLLLFLFLAVILGYYMVSRCTKREIPSERLVVKRWTPGNPTGHNIPEGLLVHQDNEEETLCTSKIILDGRYGIIKGENNPTCSKDMENTCPTTEIMDSGLHFVSFKDTEKLIPPVLLQNKSSE